MGVDIHGLNFLRYARKFGGFGPTVTLGRQGVHVSETRLAALLGPEAAKEKGAYAETLLERWFGASSVESIDYSDYEGAKILHDLNKPITDALVQKYGTVVDFGTLEHVFDIGQALRNCSRLCREGGQILHALPANNLCGHGLWQFSPELFFSLYSEANGYANTEIFLADLKDAKTWFAVDKPSEGRRITFKSSNEIYVLVRTELARADFSHQDVQQSDYVAVWTPEAGGAASPPSSLCPAARKNAAERPGVLAKAARAIAKSRGRLMRAPFIVPVAVSSCIDG
jgi:hypothetical protein